MSSQPVMSLCGLCSSIAFKSLPPFPSAEYQLTLSGLRHAQLLVIKRGISRDAIVALSRVRHHASLADLRTAADDGCKLCRLILAQADALLTELKTVPPARRNQDYLPNFEMWLSQREDGGQGFCVMSNSGDHANGAKIVPVAAFGFVVDDGDYPALPIRGRPIARNINADAIQRFVKWNTEYEQEHHDNQDAVILPQYLIDVQSSNVEGTVKIVQFDKRSRHLYAALSYASKPEVVNYWRQIGIKRKDKLSVERLPKMFQDAILVTRTLGIQYVWIDSLCVPDDSWAKDSEQAGAVYEHAYLTLSATGAKNMSDGLLFQRPPSALVRVPHAAHAGNIRLVSVAALPLDKEIVREEYIEMREQPISQDVWQFQDRVLSRRTLHFASDQMYYECLHHFASENGLVQRLRFHTPVKTLPDGTEHFRRRCLDEDPRSRWCALVWDYGQCSSRDRADKLTALSNVARAFQRLENDDYIAGHWKKSLPDSLFWRSVSCKSSGERDAPSWSWVSVDGIPSMGLGYNRVFEYSAKIIEVSTTLVDNENPFGSVTSAEIKLEAPLVPLKLLERPESTNSSDMFVVAEDSDAKGFYAGFDTIKRTYSQSAETVRGMRLFALVLFLTHAEGRPAGACGPSRNICALIVTSKGDSEEKFKRLGYLSAAESRFPYGKLGSRKIVILV